MSAEQRVQVSVVVLAQRLQVPGGEAIALETKDGPIAAAQIRPCGSQLESQRDALTF